MDGKDSKLEGTKGSTMFCVKYVSRMKEKDTRRDWKASQENIGTGEVVCLLNLRKQPDVGSIKPVCRGYEKLEHRVTVLHI